MKTYTHILKFNSYCHDCTERCSVKPQYNSLSIKVVDNLNEIRAIIDNNEIEFSTDSNSICQQLIEQLKHLEIDSFKDSNILLVPCYGLFDIYISD